MTQFIFEVIFEYGAFPGIVLYLLYIILKEQKAELKSIQKKIDTNFKNVQDINNKQNETINEMVGVMKTMHNTMANQMHVLMLKFIEAASQKNGGDK